MTLDKADFEAKVADADEAQIARLCVRWLKQEAEDHGKEGEVAQALLYQVEKLLNI